MRGSFLYEQMDVFRVAVDVARSVRTVPFPRGCTSLRDQAVRSSQSVVLNIAEGRLRTGQARRNHYEIARASAGEVAAVFFLIDTAHGPVIQEKCRRVSVMLRKLAP